MKKLQAFFLLSLFISQSFAYKPLTQAIIEYCDNENNENKKEELLEKIKELLHNNNRFDEPDPENDNMSPLYYVTLKRNDLLVRLFLNEGAGNADSPYVVVGNDDNRYYYTPLMRAVEDLSEPIVDHLLTHNANPNRPSYAPVIGDKEEVTETTPLEWAHAKLIHMKENAASEDKIATMERIITRLSFHPKIAA